MTFRFRIAKARAERICWAELTDEIDSGTCTLGTNRLHESTAAEITRFRSLFCLQQYCLLSRGSASEYL
jgi:hypothetical protein